MEKKKENSSPKLGEVDAKQTEECVKHTKDTRPRPAATPSNLEGVLKQSAPIVWPEKFLPPEVAEEVRLVPLERTKRPLYVTQNGQGYSCRALKDAETGEPVGFMLSAIKDQQRKKDPKRLPHSKKRYRAFRYYNDIFVHHAVLLAWVGPRPEGYQCDHLNGNNVDNRLVNLQWVTPSENQRRAVTLRRLRRLHEEFPKLYKDPAKMKRDELLRLFSQE